MDYDFIIIGSGFGGSVSAMRLTEKGYTVAVSNAAALDGELARSINGDVPLFVASIILIASFCQICFFQQGMHVVAQLDVLGGGLAVGMSLGVCSLMGVEFNSVVAFFPFLLLCI